MLPDQKYLLAEVISPNSNVSASCGSKIKKSEVTVLDLEGFGGDWDAAAAFVDEHAGVDSIISTAPEVIMAKWQRGCDVLLILSATGGDAVSKSGTKVMMGDRDKS